MTEAQAWRAVRAHIRRGACYICNQIRNLMFDGRIPEPLVEQMFERMNRHRGRKRKVYANPDGPSPAWWEEDAEGQRARVAFCLRMARLATPKPKKSPAKKRKAAR